MKGFDLLKFAMFVMAVSSLAMFNSGCEKENLNDLEQPTSVKKTRVISDDEIMKDLPKVKDGRLVFKDSINFANYFYWLIDNQNNTDKIKKINASLGFVCMHEIYDMGIEILNDSENFTCPYIEEHPKVFHTEEIDNSIFQDMQAPDIVGYIANEQGIYQVGNKIYRSTYDYCYCITNGDESKIQTLLNLNDEKTGDPFISSSPTFIKNAQTKSQYSYKTAYFPDEKHRIVARLKTGIVQVLGTTFYEAETDSQKKTLGIWGGWKLDGAWVSWGTGYYTWQYTNGLQYTQGSDYHTETISAYTAGGSNKQKITATFCSETINTIVIPYISSLATVHTVHYDGMSREVRYINSFTGTYE